MTDKDKRHRLGRGVSRRAMAFATAAVAVFLFWWLVTCRETPMRQRTCVCQVETRSRYAVRLANGDSLLFSPKNGVCTDAEGRAFVADTTCTEGAFVSADGFLVTTAAAYFNARDTLAADTLRSLLLREKERVEKMQRAGRVAVGELEYYARTHSVTDDGYNDIMDYDTRQKRALQRLDSMMTLITAVLKDNKACAVLRTDWSVRTAVATTPRRSGGATIVRRDTISAYRSATDGPLALVGLSGRTVPAPCSYFQIVGSIAGDERYAVAAFSRDGVPEAVPAETFLRLPASHTEGAAVCDGSGQLVGICSGGKVVGLSEIKRLCRKRRNAISWLRHNAEGLLAQMFLPPSLRGGGNRREHSGVDTLQTASAGSSARYGIDISMQTLKLPAGSYSGQTKGGVPNGFGAMMYADGAVYCGEWKRGKRDGEGWMTNKRGRRYEGQWTTDSLFFGTMTDSLSRYEGTFDASLNRSGIGTCRSVDGNFYSGSWLADRRHGFGYAIGKGHIVRAGTWKNDVFQGERMIYTAERVYGIDVSRYQHEIGRKRYGINWANLRVKSLGQKVGRHIVGEVDYPVVFAYVKATEGTAVVNRYYANDVAAARRNGVKVGAYHFFSTKSTGAQQARHFLAKARLRKGDLPPVLDVEPSRKQIAAMGGAQAMFKEIMAWMRAVEKASGTLPVLYVSQSFVNEYLKDAPAEIGRHQVWIARYGQYRPYVHLLYWQLSPYGRVSGITGEVDINVFNGSRTQFFRYANANGVK